MARFEFKMPDIGEGLADVELMKWLVNIGDMVEENQPIAEVETDKAVITMPAPATGKVVEFNADEGERVKVGSLLLVIETSDQPVRTPASAGHGVKTASTLVAEEPADNGQHAVEQPALARAVQASPVARKLARDLGIPLEDVVGTGPNGRISAEDVERYARQRQAESEADQTAPAAKLVDQVEVERVPVRGLRRRIAEGLTLSARTIPHVSGFYEFDAEALVKERAYLRSHAEAAGVRLTYLPFMVKATVAALQAHPYLNSSFEEVEPVILLKKAYHIGLAVATAEGLVVPVIHHADRLDLFEIARQAEQLAVAARERRLTPADMQGGTFTITNVGPAGGWFGTSIIRYPEAAILGVGKIEERAVVRNGQIVARPILPISLSFDHRILDGAEALAFIQTLRHYVEEDPRTLSPR